MTLSEPLSLCIWVPILFGVLVLAMGRLSTDLAKITALVGSACGFLASLNVVKQFVPTSATYQLTETRDWIPLWHIQYHLGVDGISLWFVALTSFMTVLVVLAGWKVIQERAAQYHAAFLIMTGLINGAFLSIDAILFYCFFEAMLIPMYLIIGIWGGPRRIYAAIKFFLYTLLGSLLMLASFIYLAQHANGSFDLDALQAVRMDRWAANLIFASFFLAFAVKVPMWPVHTWLPDAHVEAPTGGSVVLAAITLKIGAYGFLRFALPIVPDACREFAGLMIPLSLVAVIYIGMVALVQRDMKKLVAYSSIAHMGFVVLGIFLFTQEGMEGALIQMISHGFVSAAMFLCIGVL